jgi:hypothetical protein
MRFLSDQGFPMRDAQGTNWLRFSFVGGERKKSRNSVPLRVAHDPQPLPSE